MTDENTTDFFDGIGEGAGAPTAVLKNPGDFVHGEIVRMTKRDYVPFGSDKPEQRADGSNKQQLIVVLQTENRNWANVVKVPKVDGTDPNSAEKAPSEDDGLRAVYIPEGKNLQFAVARAVQAAKAKFEVGGKLGVRVTELVPTTKGNPRKEHEARYEAKPADTGAGFFGGETAAPAATPAPAQAAPAQAAPPAAAPAQAAPPAAPAQDPWATSAPAAPAAGDPWASPAGGNDEPPF